MKKLFTCLIALIFLSFYANAQRELIINCTGNGFSRSSFNGVDPGKWDYIQKFVNLTYNGQDASVSAVRFYVTWNEYEPTPGDYTLGRTKIVQAVQAILALKPGMKIALHFPYQRPGPQPGQSTDGYNDNNDLAKTVSGAYVRQTITYSNPSIFSPTAKQRFYAFVSDVLDQLAANNLLGNILYCEMGNGSAEEFSIPYLFNGPEGQGMYDDNALNAWRTQYLPCRYPGQSTVTWDGNTYNIASAPSASNPNWSWTSELQKEYHRFASWGLMSFYKGFRDIVKAHSSSLKVVYFISDYGGGQANLIFMHGASIPMGLQQFDGIYSSDGGQYDNWRKIRALDAIKGSSQNKIAAIEFDQDDLGQQEPVTSSSPINANMATEWIARAYKHGANNVHLAMFFNDVQIEQLKPVLASIRATYLNPSYTPPARQSAITQNLYPNVFNGNEIASSWNSNNGDNWSVTDNNPVSINVIDDGYWQNIWSCSAPTPCDFNMTASASPSNPTTGASVTLSSACTGSACSGLTYAWSGNGISGSGASVTFNAPVTAGTYTYTVTASKSGCSNKTATTSITVSSGGGSLNQCVESENSTGNGPITSDPNASNGSTRGDQNNYNHYVDYVITSVPSAGNYTATLTYSSSGTPTVGVSVNGGSVTNVNLATTSSWNIVFTTQSFTVALTAGNNTIRIAGVSGASCRQDKLCVVGSGGGCSTPSAPTLSASPATINSGSSSTLSASGCSGGTITWSDGLGTGTSKTVSPTAQKTYTATCTVSGCVSSAASVTVNVNQSGGSYSQCKESELSTGNGAITSDPNASNGQTRGEELSNNHYVEYALTGVPSAGTYYVTLQYYSSSAPTVGVSVNGGSATTVNLANSGSWNIAYTTQQFSVSLNAGSNTIRISGTGGGSCRQDRICVSNTSGSPVVLGIDPAEINIKKALSISPNPNKGIFETQFYLEKGKKATIIVVDLQGRVIYRQAVTGQGLHKERINLLNKASGTLFLQLHQANAVETKKINIAR
jgi:hypothetical protein